MYEIKIFRLVTFVTNLKHRVQFFTVKLPHAFKATCPVTDKSICPLSDKTLQERYRAEVKTILKEACFLAYPRSAICVQRFDDSLNSAIRITYRISLRSSSLREPRYPLLRVVLFILFRNVILL